MSWVSSSVQCTVTAPRVRWASVRWFGEGQPASPRAQALLMLCVNGSGDERMTSIGLRFHLSFSSLCLRMAKGMS